MSINFHANQYEQAFTPHRIQNAERPKSLTGKYPAANTGFTRIQATDRGHLLPTVPKQRSSPWGNYVGTWDLPTKIPGNRVLNPTARADDALLRGQVSKMMADEVMSGSRKKCPTVDPLPVKHDAPEDMRPAGMVCGPIGGVDGRGATEMPCPQVETTHYHDNQPRAMSRRNTNQGQSWPNVKSPGCRSPVGVVMSPKPITPMLVGDVNVQRDAMRIVSTNHNNNNGNNSNNGNTGNSSSSVVTGGFSG